MTKTSHFRAAVLKKDPGRGEQSTGSAGCQRDGFRPSVDRVITVGCVSFDQRVIGLSFGRVPVWRIALLRSRLDSVLNKLR
jgi:hypothetical protein